MAVDVIRTIASVGSWMEGSGTSSTLTERRPCHVTAFTIDSPCVSAGSLAAGDPPSEAEMVEVHKAASLDTAKGQA